MLAAFHRLSHSRGFVPLTYQRRGTYGRCRSGNRDIVGHGCNGINAYKDDAHFPFPAIRFKENTPDQIALRERERGDWRLLSSAEKKALYRASFCQTFSEFQHCTGSWKFVAGSVAFLVGCGVWCTTFCHYYVYEPLPVSLSQFSQKAQLRRMIDIYTNPIDGLCSQWDYVYDRWKWQKAED